MNSNLCALVPIKEHSERISRKNFRDFNGRPLYHWILHVLDDVEAIDSIVIDTDSTEVANSAPDLVECTIIDRPEHLCGDEVPMNDILLHDVTQVDAELFLQTHCTNPLLRPGTIREAISQFHSDNDHDSLFSVTPLQTRLWDENTEPINHSRDELLPTQQLPPVYEENSNLYIFSQQSIERRENRIGDNPMLFDMDSEEAIDIDEAIDLQIAKFLHKHRYGEEPSLDDLRSEWYA